MAVQLPKDKSLGLQRACVARPSIRQCMRHPAALCRGARTSARSCSAESPNEAPLECDRRTLLAFPLIVAAGVATAAPQAACAAAEILIESDEPGVGTAAAQALDLVLVHYTGAARAPA
jgi:hypothetical protein